MHKPLRIWVVAADGARAQLYIYDLATDSLHAAALPGLPPPDERLQSHTEKSDHPGRSFGSSGDGVRHALESRSDYRKLEKRKFTVAVANALDHAALANEFDRLILIAPSRSIGEFRKYLRDDVQSRMDFVAKDLTKAPVARIWDEVAKLVHLSAAARTHSE
jgi:protein required for attachment to host cells